MVVFFDIIYKDGTSYLDIPYEKRRKILGASISCHPKYSMLSERFRVAVSFDGHQASSLREIFASHLAEFKEGVVLKSAESKYHDMTLPWVKVRTGRLSN